MSEAYGVRRVVAASDSLSARRTFVGALDPSRYTVELPTRREAMALTLTPTLIHSLPSPSPRP